MPMLYVILVQTLWFFLPAGVANTIPVLAAHYRWWPALAVPLDGGWELRRRRLLGANKTWRGVCLGVIFGSITSLIQYRVQDAVPWTLIYLPTTMTALLWGGLLGFGALVGDAIKSFLKRQLDVAPGVSWPPFDQIDSVLGAVVFTYWWYPLSLVHIIVAVIIFGVISLLVSFIGVKLHIKKSL